MSGPLVPNLRGFMVSKAGEPGASCRDAWRASSRRAGLPVHSGLRVAIADGATIASASGLWAQLLVKTAVECKAPWSRTPYRTGILAIKRAEWHRQARAALAQPLPWFAEAALDRGAFSTLLRAEVEGNAWRAEGWGDSCLFHLRDGLPIRALPDLEPEDFEKSPYLLASIQGHDEGIARNLLFARGNLLRGDVLLLATDALACWLVTTGTWSETLREVRSLRSEEDFSLWVDELRRERGLKNDDTTLVLVEFQ